MAPAYLLHLNLSQFLLCSQNGSRACVHSIPSSCCLSPFANLVPIHLDLRAHSISPGRPCLVSLPLSCSRITLTLAAFGASL